MKRHETLLALLAVVLASAAALQIPGRLFFAIAAVVLLGIVATMRLRASLSAPRNAPGFDSVARAERIREERARRMDHRR